MNIKLKAEGALLGVILGSSLVSCGHGPTTQDFSNDTNPADEVQSLETDLSTALYNQVNVLSPHNYQDAKDALSEAKMDIEKEKDKNQILHQVEIGRTYLDAANKVAAISYSNMSDVATARRQALNAGADKYFPIDFTHADDRLRMVTSALEKNNLSEVDKNRSLMQDDFLALELRSIKKTNLGESNDKIDQAVQEGAKDLAPRSLAIAIKDLENTDAFITANRHEAEQIKERSQALEANADHLLKITRDAKSNSKVSAEDLALKIEAEQTQAETDQTALQALLSDKQALEEKQKLDRKYDEARSAFSDDEAEVYKHGDAVLIRLKGLEFPPAKSILKGHDIELLAKVEKVIKDFGDSKVTVEGHTDSLGGKIINEKLSADRAEVVKKFLTSDNAISADRVSAIGYGYEKPLATNKTAEGRAKNRRIDVLIEP